MIQGENKKEKGDMPTVLYKAGLGDIIRKIYKTVTYKYLTETTTPVRVVVASNNPFSIEIFRYHANAKNFILEDLGHKFEEFTVAGLKEPDITEAIYECAGIDPKALIRGEVKGYVPTFYAPDDIVSSGHIVFQPFAGTDKGRSFDDAFIERIIEVLRRQPCNVFLVSRNYIRKGRKRVIHSKEEASKFAGGNITVLDNLSVPATLNLIKSCSAFIGSWSSLQQAAWFENKPVAVFYPTDFKHVVNHKENPNGYGFGLDRDDCLHSDYLNADMERLAEWFKRWV